MSEITMPKLSDSMEEGTILTWLKPDGQSVEAGEDIVEIETDKATVTYAAESSGYLSIVAPEGSSLPVGATIGHLGANANSMDVSVPSGAPVPVDTSVGSAATAAVGQHPAGPHAALAVTEGNGDPPANGARATPLARRVAAAHGVSLEIVAGSGPLGRITRADVLKYAGIVEGPPPLVAPVAHGLTPSAATLASSGPAPAAAPVGSATSSGKGEIEILEPTRLQAMIARRMAESKATVPHFQVQADVVMDAAIAFRAQLKDTGADVVPSFNDLVVKASALALRAHPYANSAYRDSHFERYSRVNVGVAVASESTLVVPTIFDADEKSLGAISAESRRLAGRVRDGSVSPAELSGGTFTVSNLGMYGMTAITPVINVPQAAILGVGATREVLARHEGEIVDRHLMMLTLSCDHRILYGAQAAEFLFHICKLLEQPLRLAL